MSLVTDEMIDRAIALHNLVPEFGYHEHYSSRAFWRARGVVEIIFEGDGFVALNKGEGDAVHIWLMGVVTQKGGTGRRLMNRVIAKGVPITVSTYPKKFAPMFKWLQDLGFKVTRWEGEKVYLRRG